MTERRTLMAGDGVRVELRSYAPGQRQPRHTDRHSCITLVLKGGFREEVANDGATIVGGDVLMKSHRTAHEDQFGPEGATLASIVFEDTDVLDTAWRPRRDGPSLRLALGALDAALANNEAGVSAAALDLAALDAEPTAAEPPAWLVRLKEEVEQLSLAEIDIAARAQAAGVHPAHLSRLFRRFFRASLTEHAHRHGVRRALGAIATDSLSEVAAAAGFYDQSHMNRVFVRVTGRTPGAYRALLARAAC